MHKMNRSQQRNLQNETLVSKMVQGSCFVISIGYFFKVWHSAPPWPLLPDSPPGIDYSTRWIVHSSEISRLKISYQRWPLCESSHYVLNFHHLVWNTSRYERLYVYLFVFMVSFCSSFGSRSERPRALQLLIKVLIRWCLMWEGLVLLYQNFLLSYSLSSSSIAQGGRLLLHPRKRLSSLLISFLRKE